MPRRRLSATRPDWARVTAVVALVGFVVGVYVVVVVGGGELIGGHNEPSLPLSALATVIVALAFERVRSLLRSATARLFGGAAPSAYDVLSRFSETVTGGYATDELPRRMVRLLAEATSARWAEVWLMVGGRSVLAAAWPPGAVTSDRAPEPAADARDTTGPGRRALTVRHAGRVYGVFRLQEQEGIPLTPIEERLFAGLAAQAGLVLRLIGLQVELAARRDALADRAAELQLSRERLIAAQDEERRRLERDIHDGAQQHLVALAVNLRLAETVAARDPARAAKILDGQAPAAQAAVATLSELSRGIYPRQLSDEGLAAALRAAVAGSPIAVRVVEEDHGRLPEQVEVALYFFAMEAIQNAAKHAEATLITVLLGASDGGKTVRVTDDGVGFSVEQALAHGGTGLSNMRDRIDAVHGAVTLESAVGGGTCVTATVPTAGDRVAV